MIDTGIRTLRLMWLMPDDRHQHTYFTIDIADAQWSTPIHAFAIEVAHAQ